MDKLANWTNGINNVTTPLTEQNCISNLSTSSLLDKSLVTAPSLDSVNQELKWIFLIHSYCYATLFFFQAFHTFLSILHLRSLISNQPFMSTINMFVCVLGASRSISLFIDPYNLKKIFPKVIGSIIWDIGFPCVTSAFCLIQLAFIQLTQLKLGLGKIQKESCLSLAITGHFFFVIASDVALTSHNCYMPKYVAQTVFLVWSVLLYLMFLHAGYKINHLLQAMPSSGLIRDNSNMHQKGIMQLAMLAPYNNLASSVAAALVPTLLSSKVKDFEETESAKDIEDRQTSKCGQSVKPLKKEELIRKEANSIASSYKTQRLLREEKIATSPVATVPEVHVRPPTPTPSAINLPIITVSSPSRRSSVASRRSSDASRSSRRNSECSVRIINEEDDASDYRRTDQFSPKRSPEIDRGRSPDRMSRRHSENVTPSGSTKDLRRSSDFSHEKNRSSQFATKLRRNSDFGNRTPKRMLTTDETNRLPKVLDSSPAGSRRNSDVTGITAPRAESRRNSDFSFRRNSEFSTPFKPLVINRRTSDISIRTLDKSPTHYQNQTMVPEKTEVQEKSESDSDQLDCNEKAALMTDKSKDDDGKGRKKNLSWKNDKEKEIIVDVTADATLLPENSATDAKVLGSDLTLHSILNHIAYVNRAKSDSPLHMLEAANAATIRRSQIRKVLNVTYTTAILGIILCIAEAARIFGPYGLLAETVKTGTEPTVGQYPKPSPWALYQTLCRGLELIMGWLMASITQPSACPPHQYLTGYPNYNVHVKRGNNPYI